MIDVSDPNTIPGEIKSAVFDYIGKLPPDTVSRIKSYPVNYRSDVRCAIEKYMMAYNAPELYDKVLACLNTSSLRCFHATKIENEQCILNHGLIINDWEEYSVILCNALNHAGVSKSAITEAMNCVKHEYERKYYNKPGELCFFVPMSAIYSEESICYDQFCLNVGGELARWPLKAKMPDVFNMLKSVGKQVIIEFELPFSDIVDHDKNTIAYQFVVYFAGLILWGKEFPIEFDSKTYFNVSPTQIIKIHYYDREVVDE